MASDISLDAPNVGSLEKKWLNEAIDSGFVSTFGPFVPQFEQRFATAVQASHAVATQSGTSALHMALHTAGIGPGDEVLIPALTFVATANAVTYVGASPVLVDIDETSWTMRMDEAEKKVSARTKAIIPVHLYGNPCDMTACKRFAEAHHLTLIEDAAESLGATYHGQYCGTFGDFGCFSFNGNKVITTGGGGMVVANATAVERIRFMVNQARDPQRSYFHPEIGFNYRMTNIEAALGLAQLERLKELLEKKRTFNRIYRDALEHLPVVQFQAPLDGGESAYWLTCIAFEDPNYVSRISTKLAEEGIPTRRIFMPLCELPPFATDSAEFSGACRVFESGLCLPSSTLNSEEQIRRVAEAIVQLL